MPRPRTWRSRFSTPVAASTALSTRPRSVRSTTLRSTYRAMQRYEEAAQLFEQLLPIERRVLGPDHVWTLGCTTNLGLTYFDMGRFDESAAMLEKSVLAKRRVLASRTRGRSAP